MEARAIQRTVRQSPRKMRLVIDQIRGRAVPAAFDADRLRVRYAVVNEGPTLKRFTAAAMGRATPILKRTSHVEIHVVADETAPLAPPVKAGATEAKAEPKARPAKTAAKAKAAAKRKRTKAKARASRSKPKKKESK